MNVGIMRLNQNFKEYDQVENSLLSPEFVFVTNIIGMMFPFTFAAK